MSSSSRSTQKPPSPKRPSKTKKKPSSTRHNSIFVGPTFIPPSFRSKEEDASFATGFHCSLAVAKHHGWKADPLGQVFKEAPEQPATFPLLKLENVRAFNDGYYKAKMLVSVETKGKVVYDGTDGID
jgi:hypothetical protein